MAIGDVSDPSHVGSAALNCFLDRARSPRQRLDDRERSFAGTPELVLAGWAEAIAESGAETGHLGGDRRNGGYRRLLARTRHRSGRRSGRNAAGFSRTSSLNSTTPPRFRGDYLLADTRAS